MGREDTGIRGGSRGSAQGARFHDGAAAAHCVTDIDASRDNAGTAASAVVHHSRRGVSTDMSDLKALQCWLQGVIMHPDGPLSDAAEVERLLTRSQQLTAAE